MIPTFAPRIQPKMSDTPSRPGEKAGVSTFSPTFSGLARRALSRAWEGGENVETLGSRARGIAQRRPAIVQRVASFGRPGAYRF